MSDAIFISYRRDDSEGEAGRLYDDLIRVFGPEAVFMDVSDIHPGKDFRQAIDDNVARCTVLLAVIGPRWATIQDASGARRIEQENDFVRLEIASALAKGIDVIPVLVHEARMPNPSELPESVRNLCYRNGVELTHTRWNSDVELLIRTLREYVKRGGAIPTRQIRSVIEPVSLGEKAPVPQPPAEAAPPPPRARGISGGVAILMVLLALMAGAGAYIVIHQMLKHHKKDEAPASEKKRAPQASILGPGNPRCLANEFAQPATYDRVPVSAASSSSGSTRILLIRRPSISITV